MITCTPKNCKYFEDWPSAKIGPLDKFLLRDITSHMHACMRVLLYPALVHLVPSAEFQPYHCRERSYIVIGHALL